MHTCTDYSFGVENIVRTPENIGLGGNVIFYFFGSNLVKFSDVEGGLSSKFFDAHELSHEHLFYLDFEYKKPSVKTIFSLN